MVWDSGKTCPSKYLSVGETARAVLWVPRCCGGAGTTNGERVTEDEAFLDRQMTLLSWAFSHLSWSMDTKCFPSRVARDDARDDANLVWTCLLITDWKAVLPTLNMLLVVYGGNDCNGRESVKSTPKRFVMPCINIWRQLRMRRRQRKYTRHGLERFPVFVIVKWVLMLPSPSICLRYFGPVKRWKRKFM